MAGSTTNDPGVSSTTAIADPKPSRFDSLMAVELRGRFEQSLGCALRPTLLFDYPTIEVTTVWIAAMPLAKPKAASVRSRPAICRRGPLARSAASAAQ